MQYRRRGGRGQRTDGGDDDVALHTLCNNGRDGAALLRQQPCLHPHIPTTVGGDCR